MPQNPRIVFALAASAVFFSTPTLAQDAAAPPTAPAQAASAEVAPLASRLREAGAELRGVLTSPEAVLDADAREANRDEVVPAILRMRGLLLEGIAAGAVPPNAAAEFNMMLALYGHEETINELEAAAEGDSADADQAFGALVAAELIGAEDEAGSDAAIERYTQRAAARPASEEMIGVGALLVRLPKVTEPQQDRIVDTIENTLTSDVAPRLASQLKNELASARKLSALIGQPLVLEGATADGGTLSTADWKGKVILVDFWATWCAPCIVELPSVIDTYAEYKDQGLEVLGVSCDDEPADVTAFLPGHPGMTWPNLIEEGQGGWHPLAAEYGVTGIPTMFLIDREGIVRSVTARSEYKTLIPELLAEGTSN